MWQHGIRQNQVAIECTSASTPLAAYFWSNYGVLLLFLSRTGVFVSSELFGVTGGRGRGGGVGSGCVVAWHLL